MHYFYVLKSGLDNGFYYGSTSDLKKRLEEHAMGNVLSTKFRSPLSIAYYEAYLNIEKARVREKQVKHSGSIRSALNKRIK